MRVEVPTGDRRDVLLREYAVHGAEGQAGLGRFLVARLVAVNDPTVEGLVFRWTDLLAEGDLVLVDCDRPIDHYAPDPTAIREHMLHAGVAA